MPKLELKRKSELSRKEASERLIALGHALAGGAETELGTEGDSLSIVVADQVRWEFEIEVDGDEIEVEIEISWRDDSSGEPKAEAAAESESAARARAPRRARARKSAAK
ncbi:amphi-Trp domain-containing protein [Nocardia sp. NBC_01329]|uniref:amphi-Trp domain-containing protein n=1 Tax=Nocardia sp. NBC_01329 TaxID=2903594 RepID=UPI002E104E34|nr:amphi-Trp domain-containing protein [Nocardia sp. NBC_01329]